MRTRSVLTPFIVIMMIATAFAGCLQANTSGEPAIARVHTLTLSSATMKAAEEHSDDPMAALRELLTTDLVVRVQEEGDYTLEYTGADGSTKTATLTGLAPGAPATVSGADPMAPAVLKRGGESVSVRAGVNGVWWHMGDMPLGFNLTDGAKAKYDFTSSVRETLSLTDLTVEAQNLTVEKLLFELNIPLEGSASWELQPDTGDGSPVLVAADLRIPASAGDLVKLDLTATQQGAAGTAGVIGSVTDATASASAKVWVKDGQPVAAQFLGGQAKATPKATMWADGFFADLAGETSCAGKTKADACSPSEIPPLDESENASEKETFSADDYPRAEDNETREAITLLERLFALDIQTGDKATVIARADSTDFGPGGPQGDATFTFTVEALDVEEVNVRAGSFQAIKIIEETRTRVNLQNVQGPEGETIIKDYALDETVARTTFWLDEETYQPLKLEATMPFDADAILKRTLNAVDPAAWEQLGGKPIEDSQWSVTMVATSSYEATEIQKGSHFSALVGLGLAHALAGTSAGSPALWASSALSGFGRSSNYGTEYARPVCAAPPMDPNGEQPMYEMTPDCDYNSSKPIHREAVSLSITSAGPIMDGIKEYTVSSVTEGIAWGELMIELDGESIYPGYAEMCEMPYEGSYLACRGEAALSYEDMMMAGDSLIIPASEGQTLRFVDPYSNSVVLTMTVS